MVTKTGPVNCDHCRKTLGQVMYDASVPRYGLWGNLCEQCFVALGCFLGKGRGQKYARRPDDSWLKVDG